MHDVVKTTCTRQTLGCGRNDPQTKELYSRLLSLGGRGLRVFLTRSLIIIKITVHEIVPRGTHRLESEYVRRTSINCRISLWKTIVAMNEIMKTHWLGFSTAHTVLILVYVAHTASWTIPVTRRHRNRSGRFRRSLRYPSILAPLDEVRDHGTARDILLSYKFHSDPTLNDE